MANQEDVITLTYDLQLYLIPQVGKFPKEHKFMLGDRIYSLLMTLLEDVIEAYYSGRAHISPLRGRVSLSTGKSAGLEAFRSPPYVLHQRRSPDPGIERCLDSARQPAFTAGDIDGTVPFNTPLCGWMWRWIGACPPQEEAGG